MRVSRHNFQEVTKWRYHWDEEKMTIRRQAEQDLDEAIRDGARRLEVIKLVDEYAVGVGAEDKRLAFDLILGDRRARIIHPHATTWAKIKGAWAAARADWSRGLHFIVRYP